jgi:SAM-dependent methyltransferase
MGCLLARRLIPMSDEATQNVSTFYNDIGWKLVDGLTKDARRWEDLRECAAAYVSKCKLRVARHIPAYGDAILDMASGPIQYREYLEYSRNFKKRYCVDLSSEALKLAEARIGSHGTYIHGDFLEMDDLSEDFFDCSVSLHTIYHIHRDRQEEAVRKLLRVTKPGHPVIIVYHNPESFILRLEKLIRKLKRPSPHSYQSALTSTAEPELYFYSYPLDWWRRFDDIADVKILFFRSFRARDQKTFFPDNWIGRKMFDLLFALEDHFPNFFAANFLYPLIVMTKRDSRSLDSGKPPIQQVQREPAFS